MTAPDHSVIPARYRAHFSLRRRHSGFRVYVASTVALALFLVPLSFETASRTVLGIPGSGVALIVILAAIVAGPLIGVLVAATAGLIFYAIIADLGTVGAPFGTLAGALIWALAALVAGYLADSMRASTRQRDAEQEQARLYEALEAGLLPRLPFTYPNLNVLTRYLPSEQRLHLGGDFLDVAGLDDGTLAFVIGDVAGHGPEAAALGATLRATWRALVLAAAEAATIVATMNRIVIEQGSVDPMFVTALLVWLDPQSGRLEYVSLGHPPMVLLDADGGRLLDGQGILPLGIAPRLESPLTEVRLARPWSLVAYTDGLIETRAAPDGPRRYGEQALLAQLCALEPGSLSDEAVDRLLRETEAANGGPVPDDIALLAVSSIGQISELAISASDAAVCSRGETGMVCE